MCGGGLSEPLASAGRLTFLSFRFSLSVGWNLAAVPLGIRVADRIDRPPGRVAAHPRPHPPRLLSLTPTPSKVSSPGRPSHTPTPWRWTFPQGGVVTWESGGLCSAGSGAGRLCRDPGAEGGVFCRVWEVLWASSLGGGAVSTPRCYSLTALPQQVEVTLPTSGSSPCTPGGIRSCGLWVQKHQDSAGSDQQPALSASASSSAKWGC